MYLLTSIGKYILVHASFIQFQYISAAVKSVFDKIIVFKTGA